MIIEGVTTCKHINTLACVVKRRARVDMFTSLSLQRKRSSYLIQCDLDRTNHGGCAKTRNRQEDQNDYR